MGVHFAHTGSDLILGSIAPGPNLDLKWFSIEFRRTPLAGPRTSNTTEDIFGRSRNDTGRTPGWSPTSGVVLGTLPQIEIQRSGALRGSTPGVAGGLSGVLLGGPEGPEPYC